MLNRPSLRWNAVEWERWIGGTQMPPTLIGAHLSQNSISPEIATRFTASYCISASISLLTSCDGFPNHSGVRIHDGSKVERQQSESVWALSPSI